MSSIEMNIVGIEGPRESPCVVSFSVELAGRRLQKTKQKSIQNLVTSIVVLLVGKQRTNTLLCTAVIRLLIAQHLPLVHRPRWTDSDTRC